VISLESGGSTWWTPRKRRPTVDGSVAGRNPKAANEPEFIKGQKRKRRAQTNSSVGEQNPGEVVVLPEAVSLRAKRVPDQRADGAAAATFRTCSWV